MKKKTKKQVRRRPKSKKKPTTTAIVPQLVQPVVHWKNRIMPPEQIELLKRTVAKGTSDDEFMLFMQVCQKHGLDPFTKQIYCVMFPVSKHHKEKRKTDTGEIEVWVSGFEMVIITGIGGYRVMAARDHKDYAGSSAATFTWFDPPQLTLARRKMPESATIQILRKGEPPTTATVFWEEYAPKDLSEPRADFWNRMPKNQLEKCAEAKGLRKAFPGLGDIFTDVEMSQRLQDLTPSGRVIENADGTAPSGKILTQQANQEDVQSLRDKGLWCDEHNCTRSGKHLETCESSRRAQQVSSQSGENKAAGDVHHPSSSAATPKQEEKPILGTVEFDLTVESDPIVRGDIGNLTEVIQKHCKAVFRDGWWHVQPRDRETIIAMCQHFGYRFMEILPKAPPPPKKAPPPPPPAQQKSSGVKERPGNQTRPAGRSATGERDASSEPTLVKGTIERVFVTLKGNKSMAQVTIAMPGGKKVYGCWSKTVYEFLHEGLGKFAEVYIETKGQYSNLIGLLKVGSKEFADGKIPVKQQRDQEAGGKTLFP